MAARRQECSICMDSFKTPKLIPCHHSFCHKCLEDYVRTNLRNGRFDCPICRTSVELPKGGVSDFQSNFYIDTNNGEKFACDLCDPKSIACGRCLDCEENLCQSCCHAHEKSKATKHHKISDLGTLDLEMKGKIRQRIFCEKHCEEEIKLVCQKCNVAICVLCKVLNHDTHASKTVADAAAGVQQSLETKLCKCTEKLRRLDVCLQTGVELERRIDDAEREEINAFEKQYSRILSALEQEAAKLKGKITQIYGELRKQTADFKVDVQAEIKTCSEASEAVKTIIDQGTNFEKIQKGPDLERLITAAASNNDPIPTPSLERKLFSPAAVKPIVLISLIGVVEDSTKLSPAKASSGEDKNEKSAKAYSGEEKNNEKSEREYPYFGESKESAKAYSGEEKNNEKSAKAYSGEEKNNEKSAKAYSGEDKKNEKSVSHYPYFRESKESANAYSCQDLSEKTESKCPYFSERKESAKAYSVEDKNEKSVSEYPYFNESNESAKAYSVEDKSVKPIKKKKVRKQIKTYCRDEP